MQRRKRSCSLDGRTARRRHQQHVQQQRQLQPPTNQNDDHNLLPEEFTLGAMNTVCQFCEALRFKKEPLNCCHNGKINLPPLPQYPHQLEPLFTTNTAMTRNFLDNIRQYNSSVAFASFGGNVVHLPGRGPYTFRIHGHRAGTLHPPPNTASSYSQLYIIEARDAVETRLQHPENRHCRQDVMTLLTDTLNEVNPNAAAYKKMF
ncbi:uncharacterized protein LOC135489987 [Lineus longissimus]|uniref:uncharacterized protein LOC135489987 n=1 Tax=Lineus longissimus TaxID=88925 RepID=UPI00315DD04C